MRDAAPIEEDLARAEVELLHAPFGHTSAAAADAVDRRHQGGAATGEQELVDVAGELVSRPDDRELAVTRV